MSQALQTTDPLPLADPGVTAARDALLGAVRNLFTSDVMSKSGHGNASVRLPGDPGHILLTSRGLLRDLGTEEFAVVTLDGDLVAGWLAPENEEIVRMHTEVYRARPGTGSVIHTHSPFATAYAVAGRALPARYESLLRAGQSEDVPVAPYGARGSGRAVSNIVDTFTAHPRSGAVLLANHGVLATGADAAGASRLAVALEETAQVTLGATALGGAIAIEDGSR
ncbi:class II aldolase/adducin family protein [Microbispora hainanensis]|jgi:L-fuculose-phosphate aldolase|uniref:Class II aldolase/adducin family protein n=1 Tax=Microbispora hainanensis TaxID=568844 RepID=A0ABZ1T355_9ACTN|nr:MULTISPECIES: class II aldolase/adducin family protein [Microbispora]NJP24938.1 class II aldolase/adducin family protein [Microbispora sp. CL1-1]TQS14387.1 class II aldolase/adducin family protein [Microbispora sp. SCL1-1]